MSTKLALRTSGAHVSLPHNQSKQFTNLAGSSAWVYTRAELEYPAGGEGGTISTGYGQYSAATVAGPTSGIELNGSQPVCFISSPLAADVTISGSITLNIWAYESNMSANAAINFRVMKIAATDGTWTEVVKSARTTELATAYAVNNFSATPGTGVSFNRGDRIAVFVFIDDAGTMAATYTTTEAFNRADSDGAGGTGDTYITFTETLTFDDDPGTVSITERAYSANGYGGIAYDGSSYFVAVEGGDAWYATDPTGTWTEKTGIGATLQGIAYGNGYWAACSSNGSIYWATDPTGTWTQQTTGTVQFLDIAYGNGYWVAVGDAGKIYYRASTPNGSWTLTTQGTQSHYGVTYGNGYWVAVGWAGQLYYRSTDPAGSWTSNTQGTDGINAVAYGNGTFAAVTAFGKVLYKDSAPSGTWLVRTWTTNNIGWIGYLDGLWTINYQPSVAPHPSMLGGVWLRQTGDWGYPTSWGSVASNGTNWAYALGSGSIGSSDTPATPATRTYLTQTSAGINPGAATEYEAWTSYGGGSATAVTNTAAGPSNGVQVTATAGGTAIEWYTKGLTATTLSGVVRVCFTALESNASANAVIRAEIALTDADGTNATVWGTGAPEEELPITTAAGFWAYVSGDDLSISAGQRLRIRLYVDDAGRGGTMASGYTVTLTYAATSMVAGCSFVDWPVALTEYSSVNTVTDDFTLDAILRKTIEPTFTLDAWLQATRTDDFTLDAVLKKTINPTFALDAVIRREMPGSFSLDAIKDQVQPGTPFTLDAVILRTQTTLSPPPYAFTLDAEIPAAAQQGYFSVAAILRKTITGTPFTVDAWLVRNVASSFTLDAVLRKTMSGSSTLDAVIDQLQAGAPFTLDAVIRRTIIPDPFTLDAELNVSWTVPGDFDIDAILRKTITGSTSADAIQQKHKAPPGTTWSSANITPTGFSGSDLAGQVATDGTYYVVGQGSVLKYSTTPWIQSSWTDVGSHPFTGWAYMAYGNGYWVGAQFYNAGAPIVAYATDPTGTWTQITSGFGTSYQVMRGVAYGDGHWVIVANSIYVATDPTGTWTQVSSPWGAYPVTRIAYGNGYWVATGTQGSGYYSYTATATDPHGTWTLSTALYNAWGAYGVTAIAYGGGYFVVGSHERIAYTTDPTGAWTHNTDHTLTHPGEVQGIAYDPETEVWVLTYSSSIDFGQIVRSINGPGGTWATLVQYGYGYYMWGITHGPGNLFLASAGYGAIRLFWTGGPITLDAQIVSDTTSLYLTSNAPYSDPVAGTYYGTGSPYSTIGGGSSGWVMESMALSQEGVSKYLTVTTVAGPTDGIELLQATGHPAMFITQPLMNTSVTISGDILLDLYAYQSNADANVVLGARFYLISSDGEVTLIGSAARSDEIATGTPYTYYGPITASATPTTLHRGDRLALVIFADDYGTMGAGRTVNVGYNNYGLYSRVKFPAGMTFLKTAPAGTTVYPTTTSASINPGAATEYEAWTSRGGGVTTAITNTTTGPTDPVQVTATGGGTVVEWYTKPLATTVLTGPVLVNQRGAQDSGAGSTFRVEIGRTSFDGSDYVAWASNGYFDDLGTTEAAQQYWVVGDFLSISEGERLRIRFYIDDAYGSDSSAPMVTGKTVTLYYAGSAGATGDTYLTFTDTLTEASADAYGSFTLDAYIVGRFTLDAYIEAVLTYNQFTLDAEVAAYYAFTLDALIAKPTPGSFTLNAWVVFVRHYGDFTLDAWIPAHFHLDAVVLTRQTGRFYVSAHIARNAFTLDAEIKPGGAMTLDAVIVGPASGSFTLDAWLFDGTTRQYGFTLDAVLLTRPATTIVLCAQLAMAHALVAGSFLASAICLEEMSSSLTLDAEIHDGHMAGSFTLDADILGSSEQRGQVLLDAVIYRKALELFTIDALIGGNGFFRLDAWLAGAITLDAEIVSAAPGTGSVTLDAILRGTTGGSFTLDADLAGEEEQRSTFTLDAWILSHRNGEPPIWLDAVIVGPASDSFTLDAWIGGGFTLDAWIGLEDGSLYGGTFRLDAYIRGNDIIIWPEEQTGEDGSTSAGNTFTSPSASFNEGMVGSTITIGGIDYVIVSVIDEHTVTVSPAITPGQGGLPWSIDPNAVDSSGDPVPPWFKAARKYRIRITSDGTDITGDVIWSKTSFTQNARTAPGTFEIAIKGTTAINGGETILVEIDDSRVFGGYVMSVEKGYVFNSDTDPISYVRGSDFNVLFDRLFAYNKASATGSSGSYRNWKAFRSGTYDDTIIRKVFGSYVDLPAGFDYTTYVDRVGIANPEVPFTMPTAGSSLRQLMQSLSQVTTAVWWIDPYLRLHNHARSTVNAPYPITDGWGGIAAQVLSFSSDMSLMVNDDIVWGTLARTVEGEIRATRSTDAESIAAHGRWQYGEFRSDLHHQAYINRRSASILERYADPVNKAELVIFDPGYQAGMGTQIILSQHDLDEVLVIRSMTIELAAIKEPDGTTYYGVPRYKLSVGLDPESPWDIYDYLPFPDSNVPHDPRWRRCQSCQDEDCTCPPEYPEGGGCLPTIIGGEENGPWEADPGTYSNYSSADPMFDEDVDSNGDPIYGKEASFGWMWSRVDAPVVHPPTYWFAQTLHNRSFYAEAPPWGQQAGTYTLTGNMTAAREDGASGEGCALDFKIRIDNRGVPSTILVQVYKNDPFPHGFWPETSDWLIISGWTGAGYNYHYSEHNSGGRFSAVTISAHMEQSGDDVLVAVSVNGVTYATFTLYGVMLDLTYLQVGTAVKTETDEYMHFSWEEGFHYHTTGGGTYTSTVGSVSWTPDDGGPSYGLGDDCCFPVEGSDCDDLEGEHYGVVHEGWGCETLTVTGGSFTTTGLVTRGTLTVYDAETGDHLDRDVGWVDGGNGKTFTVLSGASSVIACYRNYIVNVRGDRSETEPRTPGPSDRNRYRPIPI